MKYPDAPDRIFLQHDPENEGLPFKQASEVTWSEHREYETDIEYVRADKATFRGTGHLCWNNRDAAGNCMVCGSLVIDEEAPTQPGQGAKGKAK